MKEKTNKTIRETASKYGVYLWEVAQIEGVSYDTFLRRMRVEMSKSETDRICRAIRDYVKQKKEG